MQGFERASGIGVGNDIIIHCIARPSWVLGSGGLCLVAIRNSTYISGGMCGVERDSSNSRLLKKKYIYVYIYIHMIALLVQLGF